MVEVSRLVACAVLLGLVACGKTGDLYLPGQDGPGGDIVTRPAPSPPPEPADSSNSPQTVDSPQTPPSPAPEVSAPVPPVNPTPPVDDEERDRNEDGGTAEPR